MSFNIITSFKNYSQDFLFCDSAKLCYFQIKYLHINIETKTCTLEVAWSVRE